MKRIFFLLLLVVAPLSAVRADEGMWLPVLLDQLNITDMQARGFKLTAEDIYSVNKSSMKDAVCQFGGGCTAELISAKGLLLTNHHCGFSYIQYHSTVEHDYLTNGFWAMKQEEELVCPGLTATFIVSMEDVTTKILAGITDTTSEASRAQIIDRNSKALEKENTKDGNDAFVRGFYYGNVFYLFLTQTFADVRMVGAPPQQIGNFGGDSDNWMWPRQTGDFSLFRIYAGKDNKPAKYSKDNVPYVPKKFFRINANGVGENDFTMVYGFPGRTTEYLSAAGVNLIQNVSDPVKVNLRTTRIQLMEQEMLKSDTVRIKYAAKRNGAANAWKKWQGEMTGLAGTGAIAAKQKKEEDFQHRVNNSTVFQLKYGSLIADLNKAYTEMAPWQRSMDYMSEGCFQVEMVRFSYSFFQLMIASTNPVPDQKEINKQLIDLNASLSGFYKDYSVNVDKLTAAALFRIVATNMDTTLHGMSTIVDSKGNRKPYEMMSPGEFALVRKKFKGNWLAYFDQLFANTMFTDSTRVRAFLRNYKVSDWKKIDKDKFFTFSKHIYSYYYGVVLPNWTKRNNEINRLNRIYMAAQMEVMPEKKYYPDANSTLRVAYGKIDDYSPRDGVNYNWYSTIDGIFQKEDSASLDYKVPPRLKLLWQAKDYGKYADRIDGKLHTTFIASNHTTGGNSGSPVLDKNGDLIGTNFDRCWEGTMSDVNYDPTICRNIVLDVRYTLFIIDKYAGAGYLLNEMVFVN